jgi:predicted nucleic acid-binding protein
VLGLTLDTGALIALERRKQRVMGLLRVAREDGLVVTVPAVVVAEWWRGRSDVREDILQAVEVEPMTVALAQQAGEALGAVRRATLADAIVMTSAALRGDVVLTADVDDLSRLQRRFPTVRVLQV